MLAASSEHCAICFQALQAHLSGQRVPEYSETDQVPLFVTWKKQGRLRGCIGNLSPLSFPQGLVEYAIRAGVHDSRFDPVKLDELPTLSCGVSLLVNFEQDHAWDDWTIGTHGIVLKFDADGETFRAVFLPEVAKEQGWSKRQTIDALAKKSGYPGKVDAALLKTMTVETFISSKAEMTYKEWKNMKTL